MKKLLTILVFASFSLLNMAAGCGGSNNDSPQPETILGIIGKWKLTKTGYYFTKSDGTKVNDTYDTEPRGINIVFEFFDDGRLVTKDLVKNTTEEIRWKVNIRKGDDKGILDGELIQIGKEQKELAQIIGQTGDLTMQMITTPTQIFLVVDVTKISVYKEMTLIQEFKKL
ncbi:MAG: hypothetical protein R2822_21075 [Spirosomataceae bacterium]